MTDGQTERRIDGRRATLNNGTSLSTLETLYQPPANAKVIDAGVPQYVNTFFHLVQHSRV